MPIFREGEQVFLIYDYIVYRVQIVRLVEDGDGSSYYRVRNISDGQEWGGYIDEDMLEKDIKLALVNTYQRRKDSLEKVERDLENSQLNFKFNIKRQKAGLRQLKRLIKSYEQRERSNSHPAEGSHTAAPGENTRGRVDIFPFSG